MTAKEIARMLINLDSAVLINGNEIQRDQTILAQAYLALESHLAKAEAIIEKAKKVETVLRIEHGHRVAEVNFGYLFDALREYDAQGGET